MLRFHYWKHIRAYIDKVNALKGKFPADTTIEKIIREEGNTHYGSPLYNNASQVFNHYFYFEQLNPKGANQPLPMMGSLIEEHYGTWEFEIPDNRGWYERIRFRLGIPHN